MSLQFITGGSGAGKSEYLSRLVCEESVRRPHDNFIVVVPEQYTMETQKKSGDKPYPQGNLKFGCGPFGTSCNQVF